LFHRFWVRLRKTAPARVGSAWAWYGWVVFAVDGSRADAPRTCRNERALGQSARDKSHPQWWITQLIHLPTKLIWDWRQGPGTSSERAHMREMIPSLPKSSLLVGDIGFGGFDLLWQLSNEQVAFVIRCGGSSTLLVEHTRQQIERQGDIRWVYLWSKNRRRKKPLRLRLIVLKRHGKRVYLLTNVQESTRLSRRMAGEFYRARWAIEVEYRGLKQTLGRRKVLARTPEPGAMELAANILAMALLLLYAALALGTKVSRLSLAKALWAMRGVYRGPALRHVVCMAAGPPPRGRWEPIPTPFVETGSRLATKEKRMSPEPAEVAQAAEKRKTQDSRGFHGACNDTWLTALRTTAL